MFQITALDAVPDIDMLVFLPEILDGLLTILGDQNPEIRRMCEATLNEFLKAIHKTPGRADYTQMINILISHCESPGLFLIFSLISGPLRREPTQMVFCLNLISSSLW